jgi:hypothetical protein
MKILMKASVLRDRPGLYSNIKFFLLYSIISINFIKVLLLVVIYLKIVMLFCIFFGCEEEKRWSNLQNSILKIIKA